MTGAVPGLETTTLGVSPVCRAAGNSQVVARPVPGHDASSTSEATTIDGMTTPWSAVMVRLRVSISDTSSLRSTVSHDRPGTSTAARSTKPTSPNSLVPVTVTFAWSGKGLKSLRVDRRPSRVVPPGRCHSLGTEEVHRSPVTRVDPSARSSVTIAETAAGPAENST